MIIGLTGYKGLGKTTAADHLVSKYGFVKVNFKDELIKELKKNFPRLLKYYTKIYFCTVEELFIKKPEPIRLLMQEYGTDLRRGERDDYWTDKWRTTVSALIESGKHVVVDDVRFLNEADTLLMSGGTIMKVQRDGYVSLDTHKSEQELELVEPHFTLESVPGKPEVMLEELDNVMKEIASFTD